MRHVSKKLRYIIGIDEVGRGPIAGPVCVGACLIHNSRRANKLFKSVRESKQLTEPQRKEWLAYMLNAEQEGIIAFSTTMVSSQYIDTHGINPAIKKALKSSLLKVIQKARVHKDTVHIQLDGGLYAPKEFTSQNTYIKGDARFMSIALASIAAKVHRDTYMIRSARKYPQYSFEIHKGYGTRMHYAALDKHGMSKIHRITFLKRLNGNIKLVS